ncbi:MAG: Carnitine transport binding protein OpuCC [Candidatus Anoxychlamydiales bacterium]|nr:Carnitine transport binding protein OpuCC [Candidatus Anoxychlamydiales bacterium]
MQLLKKRFFLFLIFSFSILLLFITINTFQVLGRKDYLIIGSKNCTESQIVSEILVQYIQNTSDIKVKRKFNLEGTFICFEALKSKAIDLYSEYTGTALIAILKEDIIKDKVKAIDYLNKTFLEKYNISFLFPLGFENSYSILINENLSKKYNIKTLSDLFKNQKKLMFAFTPEYSIRKEFDILKKSYNFNSTYKLMDQSLTYLTLSNNIIDVTNGFSTDSKIKTFNFLILEDDKKVFSSYNCAILANNNIYKKFPKLKKIFKNLENKITNEKIRYLNYLADEKQKYIYNLVKEFLTQEGLI